MPKPRPLFYRAEIKTISQVVSKIEPSQPTERAKWGRNVQLFFTLMRNGKIPRSFSDTIAKAPNPKEIISKVLTNYYTSKPRTKRIDMVNWQKSREKSKKLLSKQDSVLKEMGRMNPLVMKKIQQSQIICAVGNSGYYVTVIEKEQTWFQRKKLEEGFICVFRVNQYNKVHSENLFLMPNDYSKEFLKADVTKKKNFFDQLNLRLRKQLNEKGKIREDIFELEKKLVPIESFTDTKTIGEKEFVFKYKMMSEKRVDISTIRIREGNQWTSPPEWLLSSLEEYINDKHGKKEGDPEGV